jgi:hypothetical protein
MTETKESNKKLAIGDTVGHWTIMGDIKKQGKANLYPCRCACGKEKSVAAISLWNGKSTSCGCVESAAGSDSTKGEKSIPLHIQAILGLISQGRLPPADGWAAQGHEPAWSLASFAKVLGVSQDELFSILVRGEARFSPE